MTNGNEIKSHVFFAKQIVVPGGVIENGALRVVNGIIVKVGYKTGMREKGDKIVNLGNRTIFPGFVNINTSLEHSVLSGDYDFLGNSIFDHRTRANNFLSKNRDSPLIKVRASLAANEALSFGITTIVTSDQILDNSFYNTLPTNIYRLENIESIEGPTQFSFSRKVNGRIDKNGAIGFTPPYLFSHHPAFLKEAQRSIHRNKYCFQMNLDESNEEFQAFQDNSGDIYDYYNEKGAWYINEKGISPSQYAIKHSLIPRKSTIVNPNLSSYNELFAFNSLLANICITPSVNKKYDIKSFPLATALDIGLRVSVATGSPNLIDRFALHDELFKIHKSYPTLSAEDLLNMITLNPAKAIFKQDEIGTLEVGKKANFIATSITQSTVHPFIEFLEEDLPIEYVVINGEEIISS